MEKRERRIINRLLSLRIIRKATHPVTGATVYLPGEEPMLTDEVEEFASDIARMKPVSVKVKVDDIFGKRYPPHGVP